MIAAATEYDSDATVNVDHSTDTGLGGGTVGGCTAREGILEMACVRFDSAMGRHSCGRLDVNLFAMALYSRPFWGRSGHS